MATKLVINLLPRVLLKHFVQLSVFCSKAACSPVILMSLLVTISALASVSILEGDIG